MAVDAAAPPPPPPVYFADFIPLSSTISHLPSDPHRPRTTPTTPHQNATTPSPTLIILCTWLGGATPRRIQKYITSYRTHFHTSSILLVRACLANITIQSFASLRASLAPARDIIRRHSNDEDQNQARILLHIFSHGGCNTAIQLFRSMIHDDSSSHDINSNGDGSSVSSPSPAPPALAAVIFDCCPGHSGFSRAYRAAALSIPPNLPLPLHYMANTSVYATVAGITLAQNIGFMASIDDLRRDLNDMTLFGGKEVDRLYLYSKEDEVVDWEAVRGHASQAREMGGRVQERRFEKGMHCALVMEDEEKYWGAVTEFWGRRMRRVRDERQGLDGLVKARL